jgi:NAD(P)-dependent dehydrogenase (short-subunit alcohol dehydrogenase family)
MGWESAKLLAGKTVVVTGSSSGIGLEIARPCTAMGATVLGVDVTRRFDHVEQSSRGDLSDPRTVDALVDVLPEGIDGPADVAGLPPTAPQDGAGRQLLGAGPTDRGAGAEDARRGLGGEPRFVGGHRLARGRHRDPRGRLRADGGDRGLRARAPDRGEGGRSYFFSKVRLVAWTMRRRWRWRDRGIRVNAVSPGPVDTPVPDDVKRRLGARAEEDMRTMDRPGTPADVAPVVAFLLSDTSVWLRGAELHADGGMRSTIPCDLHGP